MKGKLIWPIFWALVAVFVVVAATISVGAPILGRLEVPAFFRALFIGTEALFGLGMLGLGVTLLVMAARAKLKKMLKAFLLLTGASAVGMLTFALLHNLVYALFIYFFGEGFWGGIGGDEPVFFIMAVCVCPLAFLVGAIGSIVLKFWKVKKSPSKARTRRKRA